MGTHVPGALLSAIIGRGDASLGGLPQIGEAVRAFAGLSFSFSRGRPASPVSKAMI